MNMKKIIVFLLAILMAVAFASCVEQEPPENEVKIFLDALKTKDMSELQKYADNPHLNVLLNSKGDKKVLDQLYDNVFKNFSYEIGKVKAGEEKATVEVKVTNCNFDGITKAYENRAYDYVVANLYSGKVKKNQLDKKCLEIYVDEVKKASDTKTKKSKTVVVTLKANDYKKWDMELNDDLMKAAMGGLKIPHKK